MDLWLEEKAARVGVRERPPFRPWSGPTLQISQNKDGFTGPPERAPPFRFSRFNDNKPFDSDDFCIEGGSLVEKRSSGRADGRAGVAARKGQLIFADPRTAANLTNGHQVQGKRQWVGHCPCHDDREPSLSVRWGRNGGTVVKCHAGCSQEALLAKFREFGFRLKPEPPPKAKRSKRPASVSASIALAACNLCERRMFSRLEAESAKAPDGLMRVTYNQFEEASVRRQSIPSGLRAMEALGLITVERSPFNVRKRRYQTNVYRLVDGWLAFEPAKTSPKAKKAALYDAREAASTARKPKERENCFPVGGH